MNIVFTNLSFLYSGFIIVMLIQSLSYAQIGYESAYPSVVKINSDTTHEKGTGIIIKSTTDGLYVLTCRHVVWKKGFSEEIMKKYTTVNLAGSIENYFIQSILVDYDLNKPDLAVLFLKEESKLRRRSLFVGQIAHSRKGAWIKLIGYPLGQLRPQLYDGEIQDEDDQFYYIALTIEMQNIEGGASGSPLLDSRGIVIGLIQQAAGNRGIVIKHSVLRDLLKSWQLEIPDAPETELIAFTDLNMYPMADTIKLQNKEAKIFYDRMNLYLSACPFLDIISGAEAQRRLSLLDHRIPGLWEDIIANPLPTKSLFYDFRKTEKKFKIYFVLKNVPDDGMLSKDFEIAGNDLEQLIESATTQFVSQFNIQAKFSGVRPNNITRWSPWAGLFWGCLAGIFYWQASESEKDYNQSLTSFRAKSFFSASNQFYIGTWISTGLAATSASVWLHSNWINSRKVEFRKFN